MWARAVSERKERRSAGDCATGSPACWAVQEKRDVENRPAERMGRAEGDGLAWRKGEAGPCGSRPTWAENREGEERNSFSFFQFFQSNFKMQIQINLKSNFKPSNTK